MFSVNETVHKWIQKRLGPETDLIPEHFLHRAKDGTLIAKLLASYDLINERDLQLINETTDSAEAYQNLNNYVRKWLHRSNIILTDNDVYDITHGEGTTALTTFYNLYLTLEQAEQKPAAKSNKKSFRTKETLVVFNENCPSQMERNSLCKPLLNNFDIINWEKDHLASVMLKYQKSRKEYEEFLEQRSREIFHCPTKPKTTILPFDEVESETSDYNYEELLNMQKEALEMGPFQGSLQQAQQTIKNIRKKSKEKKKLTQVMQEMVQDFLTTVWDDVKSEAEEDINKIVREKLLKQSAYEKQMTEKIMEVERQRDIMIKHKDLENEAKEKEMDERFINALFTENLDEQLKFHIARQELLEEHRRIYEQKVKIKLKKHRKLCFDIVSGVVDIALKAVEYKETYALEPTQRVLNTWYTLLVKDQPILEPLFEEVQNSNASIISEDRITFKEIQHQSVLDNAEVEYFLNYEGRWNVLEEDTASLTPLNVLGYIVHKILLKKYPVPIPDKPNLSANLEIAACVAINEDINFHYLQSLLNIKNTKLINMEDAVAFCEKAYDQEMYYDTGYSDLNLKEVLATEVPKGKKNKKAKPPPKKGQKNLPKDTITEVELREQSAQTPRFYPSERIELSRKAQLGKVAKSGSDLDDRLLVEMFVEYLLSMPKINGWVLLNYPNNFEQAAFLEQGLTGKLVPEEYFDITEKESLESLTVEETTGSTISQSLSENQLPPTPSNSLKEVEDPSLDDIEKMEQVNTEIPPKRSDTSGAQKSYAENRCAKLLPDLTKLLFSSDCCNMLPTCTCNQIEPIESYNIEKGSFFQSDLLSALEEHLSKEEFIKNEILEEQLLLSSECEDFVITQSEFEPSEISEGKPRETALEKDINELKRLSRLVPNPRPYNKEVYYTALTAYIRAKPKTEDGPFDDLPSPIFRHLQNIDGLKQFYCDQGCYYLLEYEDVNINTIKCLAKMIIGDFSLPLKSSIQLFGERYMEIKFEVDEHLITKEGKRPEVKKQAKPKKGKTNVAKKAAGDGKKKEGKKGKGKGKKEKVPVTYEDKEMQFPIEEEDEEMIEYKPGESEWIYVNLPINANIEMILANYWELSEQNYFTQLKKAFSLRRLILDQIVPYFSDNFSAMKIFICRKDDKQDYLKKLQVIFNDTPLSARCDPETKSQLLCELEELKDKLLTICDNKMNESEERRHEIVNENWLFTQFQDLVNILSITFQIELDRFVDSMQFITTYYISILTRATVEPTQKVPKVFVEKSRNKDYEEINTILLSEDTNFAHTKFHQYIDDTYRKAIHTVNTNKLLCTKFLDDTKKILEEEPKALGGKHKKHHVEVFELPEEIKEEGPRIVQEWQAALEGEIARALHRLQVIKLEAKNRIQDTLHWIQNFFIEIYQRIKTHYQNEVKAVDEVCEIFTTVVEEEMILQPEVLIDVDEVTKLKLRLIPEQPPEDGITPVFSLNQVQYMARVLKDLAPNGLIMKDTLLLLIQDILYHESEIEQEPLALWRNVPVKTLYNLLYRLFSGAECNWKDFILSNLTVPFPDNIEMMTMRNKFRSFDVKSIEIVTADQYQTVPFWFESESSDDMEGMRKTRTLIGKMYELPRNRLNYTSMLLDLCKDPVDPVRGLVKALELSIGKHICYDPLIGQEFVRACLRASSSSDVSNENDDILGLLDEIMYETATLEEIIPLPLIEHSASKVSKTSMEMIPKVIYDNFSNCEIGFEARDNTGLVYFLPFDVITLVIRAANFPNYDIALEELSILYQVYQRKEFNGNVLAHEYLNDPKVRKLIESIGKFTGKSTVRLMKEESRESSCKSFEGIFSKSAEEILKNIDSWL